MAYLDVISLQAAKDYLKIDDTQNETDAEITSIIKSALSHIEKQTNLMLYARDKNYNVVDGCVKVYDHPINSVESTLNYGVETKRLYKNYILYSDDETLTLNVGYVDPADVEEDIISLAMVIIKVMFYEQESDQSFKEMLPGWAKEVIDTNRRFIF